MLTSAGGFKAAKTVTIGGNSATTYGVTLRIRGVVEPANIEGGTRMDMLMKARTTRSSSFSSGRCSVRRSSSPKISRAQCR